MGSIKDRLVQQIDEKRLRPSTYMVARRLLDRAHEANGLVVITYEEAAEICETESQETVRGHLAKLAAADLITYRRNAKVNVFWHGWRDGAVQVLQPDANRADMTTNRAEPAQQETPSSRKGAGQVLQPDANCSQPRAQVSGETYNFSEVLQPDANRADMTTNRAEPTHPIGRLSRQAGYITDPKPACLPVGGTGGGQNQPGERRPPIPQDSPAVQAELERCVALLMDPDGVGIDDQTARRWAKGVPFALVRAHVFRLLEERRKRPNLGIAVLRTRLQNHWAASVPDAAKAHPLWNRYAVGDELWESPEENSEAARRAKYIPDEFSDIILG